MIAAGKITGEKVKQHPTDLMFVDTGAACRTTYWSGRRDLNPRPSPWQGDALPLSHVRVLLGIFAFALLPGDE